MSQSKTALTHLRTIQQILDAHGFMEESGESHDTCDEDPDEGEFPETELAWERRHLRLSLCLGEIGGGDVSLTISSDDGEEIRVSYGEGYWSIAAEPCDPRRPTAMSPLFASDRMKARYSSCSEMAAREAIGLIATFFAQQAA